MWWKRKQPVHDDKDKRIEWLEREVTMLRRALEKQTGKLMSTRSNEQERKDLRKIVVGQRLELYRLSKVRCWECHKRKQAEPKAPK